MILKRTIAGVALAGAAMLGLSACAPGGEAETTPTDSESSSQVVVESEETTDAVEVEESWMLVGLNTDLFSGVTFTDPDVLMMEDAGVVAVGKVSMTEADQAAGQAAIVAAMEKDNWVTHIGADDLESESVLYNEDGTQTVGKILSWVKLNADGKSIDNVTFVLYPDAYPEVSVEGMVIDPLHVRHAELSSKL